MPSLRAHDRRSRADWLGRSCRAGHDRPIGAKPGQPGAGNGQDGMNGAVGDSDRIRRVVSRPQSSRARTGGGRPARYLLFTTADEIGRWETMMTRLKAQRDAVIEAVSQLGPAVDFDLGALLDTYQSKERWEATPPEHRRELLKVAVAKVAIAPAHRRHLPADQRVHVFLVGEEEEDA
jgi:hypothetical protein